MWDSEKNEDVLKQLERLEAPLELMYSVTMDIEKMQSGDLGCSQYI